MILVVGDGMDIFFWPNSDRYKYESDYMRKFILSTFAKHV